MKHHTKSQLIRNILEFSDTTGTERLVQVVLAEFSDWANTAMTISDIARYSRISERQAQRAIKGLLTTGYINRTPGNGRGNISAYHVNVTPWDGKG